MTKISYRDTMKKIDAQAEEVLAEFKRQVVAAVRASGAPDDIKAAADRVEVRRITSRTGDYAFTRGEPKNYYHCFYIKEGTGYKEKRFVLRRDGTFNIEGAKEQAIGQIQAILWADQKKAKGAENAEIWAQHFPDLDPRDFRFRNGKGSTSLQLSQHVEGAVEVTYNDWTVRLQKTVLIRRLGELDLWLEQVCAQAESFGVPKVQG